MPSKEAKKKDRERQLAKQYAAESMWEWMQRVHPEQAREVTKYVDQGKVEGTLAAEPELEKDRVAERAFPVILGGSAYQQLRSQYGEYKKDVSEEYANVIAVEADEGKIDRKRAEDEAKPADRSTFQKATAANSEARNAGTSATATVGPGGVWSGAPAAGAQTGSPGVMTMEGMRALMLQPPGIMDFATEEERAIVLSGGQVKTGPLGAGVQLAGTGGYDANRAAYAAQERTAKAASVTGVGRMRSARDGRTAYSATSGPYADMQKRENTQRAAVGSGMPGAMSNQYAAQYLNTLDRQTLTRLQQHLAMTGLFNEEDITENRIVWGYAGDENTLRVWQQLIQEANGLNISMSDAIFTHQQSASGRMAAVLAGSTSAAAGQTIETHISDTDTIKQAAEDAFVRLLGRLPTDKEKDIFVGSIHAAERAVGQQRLAALNSRTQGKVGPDGKPLPLEATDKAEIDAILGGALIPGPMGQVTHGGMLVMPVPGGKYGNDWGQGRSGGRKHQGTDIFAPIGTPILAAKSGYVRNQGTGGVQGHMLSYSITGTDGNNYFYNHMDPNRIVVRPGQEVKAGQIIGYIGDAPRLIQTGAHLHFSINEGRGNAQNPYPLLQRAQNINAKDLPIGPGSTPQSELDEAAINRAIEIEDVNVEDSIAEQAKRENPAEYGAQQLGNTYDIVSKALRGEI